MKNFVIWLVLCVATAGLTVVGVQVLDQHFGLQQKVARFGK